VSTRWLCDAPDCDATLDAPDDGPWPWFMATLNVTTPADFVEAQGDAGYWWTSSSGERVDACSLEHLRSAMAHKIAELTDERAQS
jgi:hypothetical protein